MNKPEYRFQFTITDETNNEIVISGSTYLSSISPDGECESVDLEVSRNLRAFEKSIREKYELENYPKEESDMDGFKKAMDNAEDVYTQIKDSQI